MKEFFFFTKGQRIALVVLSILLVVIILINNMLPKIIKSSPTDDKDNAIFRQEVTDFVTNLTDIGENVNYYSPFEEKELPQKYESCEKSVVLEAFDPNELDSAGFVKLGLKPFMARNIVNYRNKGGVFRTADDFGKIYGIDEQKFEELKPYIKIADKTKESIKKDQQSLPLMVVELNSADTVALQQLPGIGSGRARQIVGYRQRLGGFSSIGQLLEINYFTKELLDKIMPFVTVEPDSIKPILVNRAGVEKLKSHPYINFYQAKAIYELRRSEEGLKSIDELNGLPEFTPEQLTKLTPYLDFRIIKYEYNYKKK